MLVLSRKVGEQILIGENVTLTVVRVSGTRVVLGIKAPDQIPIARGELQPLTQGSRGGQRREIELEINSAEAELVCQV